ncbi:MAG: hypothetical protein NTW29_21655 [Bacteroidetes bacterium]|nr:hypothetical protein [Bacteroidota bacterium]
MIPVKEATSKAINYIAMLFEQSQIFGVEEVEITDDSKYWLITIAIADDSNSSPIPYANILKKDKKKYKVVQLDSNTGDLKSVKMRLFNE